MTLEESQLNTPPNTPESEIGTPEEENIPEQETPVKLQDVLLERAENLKNFELTGDQQKDAETFLSMTGRENYFKVIQSGRVEAITVLSGIKNFHSQSLNPESGQNQPELDKETGQFNQEMSVLEINAIDGILESKAGEENKSEEQEKGIDESTEKLKKDVFIRALDKELLALVETGRITPEDVKEKRAAAQIIETGFSDDPEKDALLFAGSGIFNETELTTIFNNGGKSFEHQSELKAGETVAFQEVKGEQRELPVNQEKEEKIKQVSERIEHEHESSKNNMFELEQRTDEIYITAKEKFLKLSAHYPDIITPEFLNQLDDQYEYYKSCYAELFVLYESGDVMYQAMIQAIPISMEEIDEIDHDLDRLSLARQKGEKRIHEDLDHLESKVDQIPDAEKKIKKPNKVEEKQEVEKIKSIKKEFEDEPESQTILEKS